MSIQKVEGTKRQGVPSTSKSRGGDMSPCPSMDLRPFILHPCSIKHRIMQEVEQIRDNVF